MTYERARSTHAPDAHAPGGSDGVVVHGAVGIESGPLHAASHGTARAGVRHLLSHAGLRPTRQRVALGEILFNKGHRHVSAEQLHDEAVTARVPVSLATIYNTLHQFTEAGLLREVAIEGTKTYFDTNVDDHHHFFVEGSNDVLDIPAAGVTIGSVPEPPEGMEIVRVDVVVRLRPRDRT